MTLLYIQIQSKSSNFLHFPAEFRKNTIINGQTHLKTAMPTASYNTDPSEIRDALPGFPRRTRAGQGVDSTEHGARSTEHAERGQRRARRAQTAQNDIGIAGHSTACTRRSKGRVL